MSARLPALSTKTSAPTPSWRRLGSLTLPLAALWSAGSCAVGPNYRSPEVPLPGAFRGAPVQESAASIADLPWWELFRDDALRVLIEEALEGSGDLRAAAARVEAARARARVARDALFPTLQLQLGATRQRMPIVQVSPQIPATATNVFTAEASVSWELDLWGALRRGAQAADAVAEATAFQERGVILMLVAEVAQAYVVLLELDALHELYEATIRSRQETLRLYSAQLQAGTGTRVQVANAEALVFEVEALLPPLGAQRAQQENQIATLLGRPPGPVERGQPLALGVAPELPPGLPVALLGRRPDLMVLEQELRAAVAQIGVADARLLPGVSLSGLGGFLTTDLSQLGSSESIAWLYGAQATWLAPILGGASLLDQRDASLADAKAAALSYRQAFIAALADVADALAAVESSRAASQLLSKQVDAAQIQLTLTLDQFRAGTASYVEVTLAYQNLFPAQIALVQSQAQRSLTVIQLYRALGGGWSENQAASGR